MAAESSAKVSAPKRVRIPPKIHTAKTMAGEPTAFTMSLGTRKMPLPMTVPTTMAVAGHTPRTRRRPWWSEALSGGVMISTVRRHECLRHNADRERRQGSDRHVPGEGNGGGEADVEHEREARYHTAHGRNLAHAFGEEAQQKHSQQRSINDGRDR